MFNKTFGKDLAERLLATVAQAAIGVLVAGGLVGLATSAGLITVATAGVLCVLKAVAAYQLTGPGHVSPASFVKE